MNPRDQAEAGDGDPTKTDSSRETLPLEDRCRQAELALSSALIEFSTAASAVIDRIKAGESLPKPELDREWKARLHLIDARKLVERLDRQRKAFRPQKRPD